MFKFIKKLFNRKPLFDQPKNSKEILEWTKKDKINDSICPALKEIEEELLAERKSRQKTIKEYFPYKYTTQDFDLLYKGWGKSNKDLENDTSCEIDNCNVCNYKQEKSDVVKVKKNKPKKSKNKLKKKIKKSK